MGNRVTILFYGRLAEAIGPAVEIDSDAGCSVADLRERLARDHPAAAAALTGKQSRACVGNQIVPDAFVVRSGDRVEFLPPVSGG